MKCPICRHGETRPGTTGLTLRNAKTVLVFSGVPADVCENCGEAYIAGETAERLQEQARRAERDGVQVELLTFVPEQTTTI